MLRDWARRLSGWLRIPTRGPSFVYHPRYEQNVWGVPMDPLRGEKILAALHEEGLLRPRDVFEPRPASLEDLLRVHTAEYMQRLQDGETLTRILGVEVAAREAETIVDLQRLLVGGTLEATRLARSAAGVSVHLGGGFHHALPQGGQGFCVFNDVAVAIAELRAGGGAERVLVVDLDLHDGNGTRAVFRNDPTVHTFSIHHEHWGETDAVESTAIALGAGVGDAQYRAVLRESLPPVFDRFRPGLVFYLAGTDPSEDDVLGNWKLTAEGLRERDRFVTTLARDESRSPLPTVVLLAGGYGRLAWRHSARFLLWLVSGRRLEPLEDEDLTLRRTRRVARAVRTSDARRDTPDFSLNEQDLWGLSPGLPPPSRFLGDLSRHGVELLLERLGIVAQLRAKGFRTLRIDLTSGDGLGDTLRVVSEDRAEELLMELRVSRSRSAIADMEVLAVEWLLLQNPREAFSPRRPRLPGQQHPGLGLLKDVLGWLVVVCETHGLDGVYFMAAHYHIAIQSRRVLRFLHPEDAARASVLSVALAGLSLAEAAQALASGSAVRDAAGRAVSWDPAPMVLAVSPRLSALVGGPDYDARVAEAARYLQFHLAPGVR